MPRPGGIVAAVLLVSCSGAEPRLSLPLEAPDGADPLVRDFIEICSLAMAKGLGAAGEASKRGWALLPGSVELAAGGAVVMEKQADRSHIQINEIVYPHQHTRICMVMRIDDGLPDPSVVGKVAGLQGDFDTDTVAGGTASRGLWSFVGPDGNVVTLNTMATPQHLLQMQMATSKRLTPKAGEQADAAGAPAATS
jgi:hypothetical protein